MTALEIALLKLGKDEAPPLLSLFLEEAKQAIKNYCNMGNEEEIPTELNFIWADLALSLSKTSEKIDTEALAPAGALTSISEGDTSYSFASPSHTKQDFLDAVLNDYAYQLNKFRKLGW